MKLRQLQYLCEIDRQDLKISGAAKALYTSQPGISKQIRLLERELGVQIFTRKSGRITGITEPGAQIIKAANLLLKDSEHLAQIAQDFVAQDAGQLTVAATYTIARYSLPPVLRAFVSRYPKVHISLLQGNPTQVTKLVSSGEAELALSTKAAEDYHNVILIEYENLPRVLVIPSGHPLQKNCKPTLRDLARYPLIAPHVGSLGQERMRRIFEENGLRVHIRMTAVNVDLAKAFVENGLGLAILPKIAFDRRRDRPLCAIDVGHLFPAHAAYLTLRSHHYLRAYAYEFISMVAPKLKRKAIESAIFSSRNVVSAT